MNDHQLENQGRQVTENIWLCPDGVYRWTYEYDMLRNPTILFTVWKVLGISFGAVFLFTLVIDLLQGAVKSGADLWASSKVFVILIGVFFVISIIAYLILAAAYGWKYQVLFEMTEEHVTHIQMPRQFEKAEALGWVTALVGLKSGNPAMSGLGLNTASRNSSTSKLRTVTCLRVRRKRHTIHVDHTLDKNQVYAEDADFDFVEQFLREHCVKAKVR